MRDGGGGMTALPSMRPDDLTLLWFDQIYRDVEDGWVTLFSVERDGADKGDKHTDWATLDLVDELAALAQDRTETCCVWFGVATRAQQLSGTLRGGRTDCVTLPALWIDVDVAGENHADNTNLPATLEEAWRLVRGFPLPATAVVSTGGGLQGWWFLTEPILRTEGAEELLERWGLTWQRLAHERGHHIDSVFDLARVMRLPGTLNRKHTPTLVEIPEADFDRRYGLDDLEPWLDEKPPPRATETRAPYIGPQRPGDAYNVRHTGSDVLALLGFTMGKRWGNGDEQWARPGKDVREGTGATVYAEDGHVTIWSDTCKAVWPALEVRRPYDPFGLLVATKYGGDFARARADLLAQGYGDAGTADITELLANPPGQIEIQGSTALEVLDHGWAPVDLAAVTAAGYEPPTPEVLRRSDDTGLLYAGRINAFVGESGSGKSFIAQVAVAAMLDAGHHVLYIDLEDHAVSLIDRLGSLGVPLAAIVERFVYVQPELAYGALAAAEMERLITERPISLVVIDSVGEAMALQAQKQNDDDDVARWYRALPRRFAALGPAVVLVDHVPKAKDAPPGYAIGSQRKRAAIDGAMYRVEQIKSFGRNRLGLAKLTCAKDRNGRHPTNQIAAMFHLDARQMPYMPRLETPASHGDHFRPTTLMERISTFLEGREAQSKARIEDAVKGNREGIRTALQALIDEGFVGHHTKGQAVFHWSEKPFRASDEDPEILVEKPGDNSKSEAF